MFCSQGWRHELQHFELRGSNGTRFWLLTLTGREPSGCTLPKDTKSFAQWNWELRDRRNVPTQWCIRNLHRISQNGDSHGRRYRSAASAPGSRCWYRKSLGPPRGNFLGSHGGTPSVIRPALHHGKPCMKLRCFSWVFSIKIDVLSGREVMHLAVVCSFQYIELQCQLLWVQHGASMRKFVQDNFVSFKENFFRLYLGMQFQLWSDI